MRKIGQIGAEQMGNNRKRYGAPYQGNKSRIADLIIDILPPGERFVDLFGGGGAITHCALLSDKWHEYLYNDINPLATNLFLDAIHGKYADENRVITREDFHRLKDSDGYVAYLWSFGNSPQKNYLWSRETEDIKLTACRMLMSPTLSERRAAYREFIKLLSGWKPDKRLEPVERLQALSALQSLQRLESLQRPESLNIDYREYQYKAGDVVYCDIPYEMTDGGKKSKEGDYGGGFNHAEFYEWVKSRPYQVFFSSYKISDSGFYCRTVKEINSIMCAGSNSKRITEFIYSNRPFSQA